VPLAAVATLVGPAAGTAFALRPARTPCLTLLNSANDNWDDATYYELAADTALSHGDLLSWAEDNTLDNTYSDKGDEYLDLYVAQGC
jgi:hypothetical protein